MLTNCRSWERVCPTEKRLWFNSRGKCSNAYSKPIRKRHCLETFWEGTQKTRREGLAVKPSKVHETSSLSAEWSVTILSGFLSKADTDSGIADNAGTGCLWKTFTVGNNPHPRGAMRAAAKSQRQNGVLSSLNAAIDTLDLARDSTNVKPARDAFCSAGILLTTIRVRFLPAHLFRSLTGARRIL